MISGYVKGHLVADLHVGKLRSSMCLEEESGWNFLATIRSDHEQD